MIDAYVSPRIGDVLLQQLSVLDLDRLYATLATEGRQRGGGGLSLRTVRYVHAILSKALGDAERKGLVARNVTGLSSPPKSSATRAPNGRPGHPTSSARSSIWSRATATDHSCGWRR
jgi:integrase